MTADVTACILCSRNCGLSVETDGRRLARIKGDPNHPLSKGYVCQKAARLEHYQNNADRLSQPLQRQADGRFVPVSWDEALTDIAQRLQAIRSRHGGQAFATAGGGGQGNHMGGAYLAQIRAAMGSHLNYNSLGQEKTGDFWVNGRLFGRQDCHTTEDVEESDYVIFLGCNPYQSHGIPNARDTLKAIKKDPARTMVVIDPRVTETAKQADIHLQLKPSTDAYLLSAMLAIIVREGLHDQAFIEQHCTGFEAVEAMLLSVPIDNYIARTGVPEADVYRVARGYARARAGCMRVDLGIQHSLHTTLNGYLEKLFYLLCGHFGKPGGNNLHSSLIPILSHTDERNPRIKSSAYHQMFPVSGILPPNILPDEILQAGEDRIRAMIVDSCNPLLTWADTARYEAAFGALELLVVVDVAMTETARLAHYVLPAASQFEKWEFTGFNLEFPANAFHLRHPLFKPFASTLPEPEIYTRLLEYMGELPTSLPWLSRVARHEPRAGLHLGYMAALAATLARQRHWVPYAASLLYRTLGPQLPQGAAAAALLLPLCLAYANQFPQAVRRAGHRGNRLTLGARLFKTILAQRSGVVFSVHRFDEVWSLVKTKDRKIHLQIPEMLAEWERLGQYADPALDYPFILMAGERRSYNANQIFRDPGWRKVDHDGALRLHPADARTLGLKAGDRARCESAHGQVEVVVSLDDSVQPGVVTLPHGYGARFNNGDPQGPQLNRLVSGTHCDPFSRTPYHKFIPVHVYPLDAADAVG